MILLKMLHFIASFIFAVLVIGTLLGKGAPSTEIVYWIALCAGAMAFLQRMICQK